MMKKTILKSLLIIMMMTPHNILAKVNLAISAFSALKNELEAVSLLESLAKSFSLEGYNCCQRLNLWKTLPWNYSKPETPV